MLQLHYIRTDDIKYLVEDIDNRIKKLEKICVENKKQYAGNSNTSYDSIVFLDKLIDLITNTSVVKNELHDAVQEKINDINSLIKNDIDNIKKEILDSGKSDDPSFTTPKSFAVAVGKLKVIVS